MFSQIFKSFLNFIGEYLFSLTNSLNLPWKKVLKKCFIYPCKIFVTMPEYNAFIILRIFPQIFN